MPVGIRDTRTSNCNGSDSGQILAPIWTWNPVWRRESMFSIIASLILPSFFSIFLDFVLEGFLEVFGMESRDADEGAVGKKAAVGDDGVQVRNWD